MNIYKYPRPQTLDIVFPNHDANDIKEIHKICRKHIKGYGGHRWNKQEQVIEFHAEEAIGPWTMERLFQELEDWAYQEPEVEPKLDEAQSPPPDEDGL